jgi:hypothetical protein
MNWETSTIEQIPTLPNVDLNKLLFFAIQNIRSFSIQHAARNIGNLINTK